MSSEHHGGHDVDIMEKDALVEGLGRVFGFIGGVHELPMIGAAPEEAERHVKKNHSQKSHAGH